MPEKRPATASPVPAIIVHGGAGDPIEGDPTPNLGGVRRAAEAGRAILVAGGDALDAVEAAVRTLEDDPVFNSGTGASLNAAGEAELDASIMEGAGLRCGAVAGVRDIRNPIALARLVMERTPHVLLAGAGASAFAREQGIEAYPNERLITPRQRARWQAALAAAGQTAPPGSGGHAGGAEVSAPGGGGPGGSAPCGSGARSGTVGAVAFDSRGHLAAATSTGGMLMKRPGRVGDTPLIGCGNFADDRLAAVSCTGHGERIIQVTLARLAADLCGRGLPAMEAAREAIGVLESRVGGDGGLILIDRAGQVGFAHNSPAMARAYTTARGELVAEV